MRLRRFSIDFGHRRSVHFAKTVFLSWIHFQLAREASESLQFNYRTIRQILRIQRPELRSNSSGDSASRIILTSAVMRWEVEHVFKQWEELTALDGRGFM
jgi:hypothetical protein